MAVLIFPGADAILAAQAAALPQADQLCGPFTAFAALHGLLEATDIPSMVDIASASSTAIWPHDEAGWRPTGAPFDQRAWDLLPTTRDPATSGTDAAGLARGIETATDGQVAVVPVTGRSAGAEGLETLLVAVARSAEPVTVLANVRTGVLDLAAAWDVGHFIVLWAVDVDHPDGTRVAVADTYRELGAPGQPPGCRWVPVERLAAAIASAPGRGLLLATRTSDTAAVTALVSAAGLDPSIWST